MENCSYVDSQNVSHVNVCATGHYCCGPNGAPYCTTTNCNVTMAEVTPTVFWAILGGLCGLGILILVVLYVICKYKKIPRRAFGEETDIFEETITETEIHTVVTHSPRFSRNASQQPAYVTQTQNYRSFTKRQQSSHNKIRTLRVQEMKHKWDDSDSSSSRTELWDSDTPRTIMTPIYSSIDSDTDRGQKMPSIGN